MGTGLISGAATADLSEDITFPVAFSSTPTVVANAIGYKSAGGGTYDPSTISDDWSGQTAIAIKPAATGFKVRMRRIDNLSYASGTDYYYNWIAVGEA